MGERGSRDCSTSTSPRPGTAAGLEEAIEEAWLRAKGKQRPARAQACTRRKEPGESRSSSSRGVMLHVPANPGDVASLEQPGQRSRARSRVRSRARGSRTRSREPDTQPGGTTHARA